MERLLRLSTSVAQWGAWMGGGLLLLCCVAIGVEVILRKFFSISLRHIDEMTSYTLALSSVWGFAFTLLHRAHVRIDTFYVLFPLRLRAALDILSLAAVIAFFGALTWFGWKLVAKTSALGARSTSPLGTPLVIPQSAWILGLTAFLLVAVVLMLQAVLSFLRDNPRAVQRLIGTRSLEEEVAEETVVTTAAVPGFPNAKP